MTPYPVTNPINKCLMEPRPVLAANRPRLRASTHTHAHTREKRLKNFRFFGPRRNGSLLPPKVLEPGRRKLGIPHRVLDRSMAKPILDSPRIVPRIGQGIAAAVP